MRKWQAQVLVQAQRPPSQRASAAAWLASATAQQPAGHRLQQSSLQLGLLRQPTPQRTSAGLSSNSSSSSGGVEAALTVLAPVLKLAQQQQQQPGLLQQPTPPQRTSAGLSSDSSSSSGGIEAALAVLAPVLKLAQQEQRQQQLHDAGSCPGVSRSVAVVGPQQQSKHGPQLYTAAVQCPSDGRITAPPCECRGHTSSSSHHDATPPSSPQPPHAAAAAAAVAMHNAMRTTCARDVRCEDAQRLFDSLTSAGLEPNVIMYTALIVAYARADRCNDAQSAFDSMASARVQHNDITRRVLKNAKKLVGGATVRSSLSICLPRSLEGLRAFCPNKLLRRSSLGRALWRRHWQDAPAVTSQKLDTLSGTP